LRRAGAAYALVTSRGARVDPFPQVELTGGHRDAMAFQRDDVE
jgi:hypothetical protein